MTDAADRFASLSPAKRALLDKLRPAPATSIPRIFDGPAPLSAEQRRLWYLLQMAGGYPVYTIPLGFRVEGELDAERLEAALRALVARHEGLRTAFRESAGVPVQEVVLVPPLVLARRDLRGDPWCEEEADYLSGAFARTPYRLERGEVIRALLIQEDEARYRLLLGLHHLVADGFSAGVLLAELGALYAGQALAPVPELRFRDWAAWQQRAGGEARPDDAAFWRAELEGVPRLLELPSDRPPAASQGWEGAKHAFDFDAALAAGVRRLARELETTPYAVTAAAFATLLSRYSGQPSLLLGTVLANRPRAELEGVVGFFANTLPLRVEVDESGTVAELITALHRRMLGVHRHGGMPFDQLVEQAGVRRDLSRPPLIQAMLAYADATSSALTLPGLRVTPLLMDSQTSIFELSLLLEDAGEGIRGALQYATDLFDLSTVERIAAHFTQLLRAFVAAPERPLYQARMAGEDELRTVLAVRGAPPAEREAPTLHGLFELRTREAPDAPALLYQGEVLSYAELNRAANRVAHGLIARGAGPEHRVGVCMARTPQLVATLLGVLKAGAAYVPLDPAHPPARSHQALALSRARWVVVDAGAPLPPGALPPGVEQIGSDAWDREENADPPARAESGNLGYVIFTSGSTGGPKGVEIEHGFALDMVGWVRRVLSEEERRCVLGGTPLAFDVSVAEIFATLGSGGSLALVENALAPLPGGVSVYTANMTPTAAAELLREGRLPPSVRTVQLGGEAVPPALVSRLLGQPGVTRVLNLYGPAEDTTYTSWAELDAGMARIPVGRPTDGGRVYVLDARLRPTGIGAPGELWTAGSGVARGYASRPGLTAERFLPDPWGAPGARMYRTGDRGRWREDGQLEYLGRMDAQVKVRGHRIELAEVEQALAAHPALAAAAAAVRPGADGENRLVGYLVPREGGEPPPAAELRAFLRERVPEYMLPSALVTLAHLPLTSSEKLDRRALPDPEAGSGAAEFVAPRSELEGSIAEAWREVLGVERVGVHDDFFDLGGQSILATRLVSRLRDRLGIDMGVAELLQTPTVEGLAGAVQGRSQRVQRPLVALQTFGERPPLFLAHPAGGHVVCYRGLGVFVAPEQPVYALQPRGVEDGREPLRRVEEMAGSYVEAILRSFPRGPWRVGGWSFGGVLAWEIARRLWETGGEVDLLALFDTQPHLPGALRVDPRQDAEVMWHTVAGLVGHGPAGRVDVETLRGLAPRDMALAMVRGVEVPQLLDVSRVDDVLALTRVRAANMEAQLAYRPAPYPGHLTYFSTQSSAVEGSVSGLEYWSALAQGGATEHPVGGSHGTILQEPYVHTLAQAILAEGWLRDE